MLQRASITNADVNGQARAAALDFARCLALRCRRVLGNELLGVYLIGSLAHAGFSWRYSDVDVALVTEAGLPAMAHDRIRRQATALSVDWGPKVSIFWADRRFSIGRFPPLDRIDYLDNAITLMERDFIRPARPTLTEIQQYLRGEPFASWADRARSFAAADTLEPQDRKAYLRALLYPARFCYSWMTGRMGSNDDAVAFVSETPVAGLNVDLVVRALNCRQTANESDGLFPARATLLSQIDACTSLFPDRSHSAH